MPSLVTQEFAGASDGGAEGKHPESVIGSLDQGIGQGVPLLDDLFQPGVDPQSQESSITSGRSSRRRPARYVRASRQGPGQGQDQG